MPNGDDLRLIAHWARCIASVTRSKRLAISHFVCAYYVLRESSLWVQRALKEIFGVEPNRVSWPDPVKIMGEKVLALGSDAMVPSSFPFDAELQQVMDQAYRSDPTLSPSAVLRSILNSDSSVAIEWRKANHPIGILCTTAVPPLVRLLDRASQRSAALREFLGGIVLGQEHAVEMLGNAFFQANLGESKGGPRGIFTFLGPQGVGKTLMAEAFAEAMRDIEGEACVFKRFDMGLYATYSDLPTLYSGSEGGDLTGFVNANPNCVLLFDEIEKALPAVIQSFLPMLDSGLVYDKSLKKNVSFSGAWIIFTTNLGREFFDKASLLGDGATVSAEAFDILVSARDRRDLADGEAMPVLSPEFVSRISKGGAVIFSKLEARHLLELVEQGLRSQSFQRSRTSEVLPEIQADLHAQVLFLLSLLPNLDARKAASRSRAWGVDIIRAAYNELREDLSHLGTHGFTLRVTLSTQAGAFLADRMAKATQGALLIDEDLRTYQLLEPVLAEVGTTLKRCTGMENLQAALERDKPRFILLDLSIHKGPSSSEVDKALAILEYLRAKHPDVPIYSFSENPDRRAAFDTIAERVIQKGGVKGFIPYFRNSGGSLLEDAFLSRVMEISRTHLLEVLFRNQERGHVQVHFQPAFSLDAHASCIKVELDHVTEQVVVNATDHADGIGFSGIPRDRLEDVIGLDRAKERLRQVLGWIRNPRQLWQLGGNLPRGYLLAGPPGCGKTMLARAFAGEAGLPFLSLSGSEIASRWVGESEKRLREIFEKARKYAPTIIFIDEIDSLAPDRSRISSEMDWKTGIVNQLLVCMDGFQKEEAPVFVLGATNNPDRIDPALRRPGRFDEVIPLDLPPLKARLAFLRKRLERVPCDSEVDLEQLARATVGMTPAFLDRLVREATYLAANEGRRGLIGRDLAEAKKLVLYGAEVSIEIHPDELELTAHHEAGHAIARLRLFPECPIDLITIAPNERGALGFVASHRPENQHSLSLAEIESELTVLLAGREAERRLRGDKGVTTGARSDLERASGLALQAVAEWGLDEQIGPLVPEYGGGSGGIDISTRVQAMLFAAQERARVLLGQNAFAHMKIVEELLEQQTISGHQLGALARACVDS